MAKVTRAHIVAARARRDILRSQKKAVPLKIEKLASLDPSKFPRTVIVSRHSGEGMYTVEVHGRAGAETAKAETQLPHQRSL